MQSPKNPALNEQYTYDASGNMVSKSIGGKVMKLDYDLANQLTQTQIGGAVLAPSVTSTGARQATESVSYQYDQAGRLLSEQSTINPQLSTKSYSYSYLDKVRSVSVNGAVTASYTYDAAGMLVQKHKQSTEVGSQRSELNPQSGGEPYLWNGISLLSKGNDQYSNESHLTGGLPLVTKSKLEGSVTPSRDLDSASQYSTFDYLGTSLWSEEQKGTKETKESGSTTFSHGLTSYGETSKTGGALLATPVASSSADSTLNSQPSSLNRASARFTGKPYDADLGAYVFPFRNYRPELARWTSADPAGFPDGPNGHFYAPVATAGVDVMGLFYSGTYYPNGSVTGFGSNNTIDDMIKWNAIKAIPRLPLKTTSMSHADGTTGGNWSLNSAEQSIVRAITEYTKDFTDFVKDGLRRDWGSSGDGAYGIWSSGTLHVEIDSSFDVHNAIGGADFSSYGSVSVTSGLITYYATVNIKDPYTFSPYSANAQSSLDPLGIGYRLENSGFIKSFQTSGSWSDTFTAYE